jgi:hypothetical protein
LSDSRPETEGRNGSLELSPAGWLLVVAVVWELLVHRLASELGLFASVGAEGPLAWLADSGRLAMNATGIMALVLGSWVLIVRAIYNPRLAALPWRLALMFATPVYVPVLAVSIVRPLSPWFVLLGYAAATVAAAVLALIGFSRRVDGGRRRIFLALALIVLLPAFSLISRLTGLIAEESDSSVFIRRAYLLAEVLLVVTPIYAFFALWYGRLRAFVRRPHLPALLVAVLSLGGGIAVVLRTGGYLPVVAARAFGVFVAIPGPPVLYLLSLFFGSLLVGSCLLPSRRWPPQPSQRRAGMGLLLILACGLQPTHPYQIAATLAGFALAVSGLLGERYAPAPRRARAAAET